MKKNVKEMAVWSWFYLRDIFVYYCRLNKNTILNYTFPCSLNKANTGRDRARRAPEQEIGLDAAPLLYTNGHWHLFDR